MNIKQWWIARKLIKEAYKAKKITGLPASIVASQAILETGWLRYIPKDYITGETSNNLFGIKFFNDHTTPYIHIPYVECYTHEYYNGKYVSVLAKFRKYKSYEESFIDYGNLILKAKRYKEAVANKGDARAYIYELWKAGYATSPDYPQKILRVAECCKFIPKER